MDVDVRKGEWTAPGLGRTVAPDWARVSGTSPKGEGAVKRLSTCNRPTITNKARVPRIEKGPSAL